MSYVRKNVPKTKNIVLLMLSASVIDNIVIIDIKRFKYYNLYGECYSRWSHTRYAVNSPVRQLFTFSPLVGVGYS